LEAGIIRALPISWSPDGRWIAFAQSTTTDLETRIFLLSTSTWQSERIESSPECQQEESPAFSHDGSSLAFACYLGNNESGLFIRRLNSRDTRKILLLTGFIEGTAWISGDQSIVYSLSDAKSMSLREVSVKTSSTKRLMYEEGNAFFPTVSATGRLALSPARPFMTSGEWTWVISRRRSD
jgi:Tol biopolymer transport system component